MTIIIDGREALPLRAIPYVTRRQKFSPAVIVAYLARYDLERGANMSTLSAYRIKDNNPVQIPPLDWINILPAILEIEAKSTDQTGESGVARINDYEKLHSEAVEHLPDGVFVWLDDFKKIYDGYINNQSKLFKLLQLDEIACSDPSSFEQEVNLSNFETDPGLIAEMFTDPMSYAELELAPILTTDTRAMVREGFEITPRNIEKDTVAVVKQAVPDGVKGNRNTPHMSAWSIVDSNDPNPEQPWYTPARYFARQLVKDDTTLLTKKSLLATKVSQSLTNAGIYKRGGKLPVSDGTVLKALSNVSLG